MGGDDNKMIRRAYENEKEKGFDDLIEKLSEEAKEEAIQQKNARMFINIINKQFNYKMRNKSLFPIIRMRMPIRK